MKESTKVDAELDAAFAAAEREIDAGEFPTLVAQRIRSRARVRRTVLVASAVMGAAIAAPHVPGVVAIAGHRFASEAPFMNAAGWLVAAAVAMVVLDAMLPIGGHRRG